MTRIFSNDSSKPQLSVKKERNRWDTLLQEGLKIISKTPAAKSKIENTPTVRRSDDGPRRQDYRMDDRLPLTWKILSEASKQHVLATFDNTAEFIPRVLVEEKKNILLNLDDQIIRFRMARTRVGRLFIWFRDQFEALFLAAPTENEEEYFLTLMHLLIGLLREVVKRGGLNNPKVAQIFSYFKDKLDLQKKRDHVYPITPGNEELKHFRGLLVELEKQLQKQMQLIKTEDEALAKLLEIFHESINAINLTHWDGFRLTSNENNPLLFKPVQVNLSNSGLAFETRNSFVKQSDFLEILIGLHLENGPIEMLSCLAEVMMVRNAEIENYNCVACKFTHMPIKFRQMLPLHIINKQRELLALRAQQNI
ncbi:MAG: hypothetical protein H7832_11430 [Magnetococcus sp. DMHC-6]